MRKVKEVRPQGMDIGHSICQDSSRRWGKEKDDEAEAEDSEGKETCGKAGRPQGRGERMGQLEVGVFRCRAFQADGNNGLEMILGNNNDKLHLSALQCRDRENKEPPLGRAPLSCGSGPEEGGYIPKRG